MTQPPLANDWHRYCRIMLEWLHPKRDLDPATWVEEVVARAQDLKVDALAFDFYHGGYTIFDGGVAPKDRHIGDADLLALLDEAVHRRGMRLVAMNMGAHCAAYMAEEYPTWRERDAEGQPRAIVSQACQMCLNTPYADFLLQELRGILTRYRIDGLYIEGLYGQDCYCDYCCHEFSETYGYPIPREPDVRRRDPNYARFRASVRTDFVRKLRGVIHSTSPDTVLIPCPSGFENCYTDLAGWGPYSDAVELERQWGYERDQRSRLFELGLSMQVVAAESGRPALGTLWLGWGVDRDYSNCTASHYRLNFAEILLYGATPQLHAQTIFEIDDSEAATVREMFGLVEKVRPTLLDASLVSYAGLVVDWSNYRVSEHAKGYYQALIEHHVPFQVLSPHDLRAAALHSFKVVLLPNVERLSDEQIAALRDFHAAGGGIVSTYRTGIARPDGSLRETLPLGDLAGIAGPFGIASYPPGQGLSTYPSSHAWELLPNTYYRVVTEHAIGAGTVGRLQSFQGNWVEVEATAGLVIAQALEHDYSKMHRHHPVYGWYPGQAIAPLIVALETPGAGQRMTAGRGVYFAGDFDRVAFEAGLPGALDSLAQAAVWAVGCRPPVEAACSPTVEIATHYSASQRAYTLLMVNKTTNELGPGVVVRHVEPLVGVSVTLHDLPGAVREVRSLTGGRLRWDAHERSCTITLDCLREYEAIVVELGS